MIELTEVDTLSSVFRSNKVSVMPDQVTHVSEFKSSGRDFSKITFVNGAYIVVAESVDDVSARIRAYVESAKRTAIASEVERLMEDALKKVLAGATLRQV